MTTVLFFLIAILFAYSVGAVSFYLAGICSIEFFTEQAAEVTKNILALLGLATLMIGIYSASEK